MTNGGRRQPPAGGNAMKAKAVLAICAVIVFAIAVSGAWGASLDDVRNEASTHHKPVDMYRTSIWVPLYGSGQTAIPYNELCVSGDKVRRVNADGTSVELGQAPVKKDYTVLVNANNYGDQIIIHQQQVDMPACK